MLIKANFSTDLEQSQVMEMVKLLMFTIPRYPDPKSRNLVLPVLAALFRNPTTPPTTPATSNGTPVRKSITGGMIKWIEGEVEKANKAGTMASTSKYVLFTWAAAIYDTVTLATDLAQFKSIVTTLSTLLDSLLDEAATPKLAVRNGATIIMRRAIRLVSIMLLKGEKS